jgi:hypothetical protein
VYRTPPGIPRKFQEIPGNSRKFPESPRIPRKFLTFPSQGKGTEENRREVNRREKKGGLSIF